MACTKIKKNDQVKIIVGKDKGKTGKVQFIDVVKGKVIVAGVNMVNKTVKRKSQQEQGGIVNIEASIAISNVQLVSKGNVSKLGYKISNGKKVRFAKKTGEEI